MNKRIKTWSFGSESFFLNKENNVYVFFFLNYLLILRD